MELYIYISLWYTHAIMLYTCTHTVYIYCMYIYISTYNGLKVQINSRQTSSYG
jgi:hypothetical protein